MPRLDLRTADRDATLERVRQFIKLARDKVQPSLIEEFTAAKLGIPSWLFQHNPGFLEFAQRNHLERYLIHYGHQLQVQGQDILIMCEKEMLPWNHVKNQLVPLQRVRDEKDRPWQYGPDGVQSLDLSHWRELQIFEKHRMPAWGNRYLFEYCIYYNPDEVNMVGHHGYFRLYNPEGNVYECTVYRPEKRGQRDNFCFPFRRKVGFIQSHDISTTWKREGSETIATLRYEITAENFQAAKAVAERYKLVGDRTFENMHDNCISFAKECGAAAGVDIPSGVFTFKVIMATRYVQKVLSLRFQKKFEAVYLKVPHVIRYILQIPIAICLNIILVILGGAVVDEKVKRLPNTAKKRPHMALWQIFDQSKLKFHHPYFIAEEYFKPLNAWRQQQMALHPDLRAEYEFGRRDREFTLR